MKLIRNWIYYYKIIRIQILIIDALSALEKYMETIEYENRSENNH